MNHKTLPERNTPYRGRGRVLRVKEGYNPNSSSLGSVVFSIHTALIAAPLLLAGAAAWIASRFAATGTQQPPAAEPPQPGVKP